MENHAEAAVTGATAGVGGRLLLISGIVLVGLLLALLAWWWSASRPVRVETLQWGTDGVPVSYQLVFNQPDEPGPTELRTKYELEKLVASAPDDTAKLVALTGWAHSRWEHNGSNQPSRPDPLTILKESGEGKRFRCVEYGEVITGAAQALGMPARVLGIKTSDAATRRVGAGHVVAEVWLADRGKWAFADGQFGYVPMLNGVPLNAVEFQRAVAAEEPGLTLASAEGPVSDQARQSYLRWVSPYLYYFDFVFDERQFKDDAAGAAGSAGTGSTTTGSAGSYGTPNRLELVPKGAPNLTVFQRTMTFTATYTSDPAVFYRSPEGR